MRLAGFGKESVAHRGPGIRVLHIYKDYPPVLGGIELHVRLLAEAQARMGYDVTVLTANPGLLSEEETRNGVRLIRAGRLGTAASTPVSLQMPRILRRLRLHLAHLHFPYPWGEVSQLLFGQAPCTVVTYHSDIIRQKALLRFYRPVMNRVLRRVRGIIVTSGAYLESSPYLGEFRDKCAVIPLGIDLKPFLRSYPSRVRLLREFFAAPMVLFVGKLRYYKGLETLIEAVTDLDARLVVLGKGPLEGKLRDRVLSMKIGDKVAFLGEVTQEMLPAYYQAADVLVLPSSHRSEAFGLVLVEAMASGLPVVSTELGTGTSFVNVHGKTGLVVPPGDPVSLKAALSVLLEDGELRRQMGSRGRVRALTEFSATKMVHSVCRFYDMHLRA